MAPGQELRRRVDDDVGALVERAQVDRGRDGRVADDEARVGRAAPPSRASVSVGFAGDSTQTMSAPAGGGPVWSYSTKREAPRLELAQEHRGAEVGALGEGDRRPGPREGEQDGGRRRRPGGEEERLAALELAEPGLGGRPGRMPVAGVEELARLAALVVAPDRRAVDSRAAAHRPEP